MAKIMTPSGEVVERTPIYKKGAVFARYAGKEIMVLQVLNVGFDFIFPGYGYGLDFWGINKSRGGGRNESKEEMA